MHIIPFAIMHIISIVKYFFVFLPGERYLSIRKFKVIENSCESDILSKINSKNAVFCLHFAKPPCSMTDAL